MLLLKNREDQHEVLTAFRKVLGQELHNLKEWPEVLWQQMYNRLQWIDGGDKDGPVSCVIAPEFKKRTAPGANIWFRTRTPLHEAETLIRTLLHEGVHSCIFSPKEDKLCSWGNSIRLWSTSTGDELARISDVDDPIVSAAFDCEGNYLVTGSRAGKVQISNAKNLIKMAEFCMNGGEAYCATSSIEQLAVIASGNILKVIELPSGFEQVSSSIKGGIFTCCSFSKNGELIATGDNKGIFKLYSANTLNLRLNFQVNIPNSGIKACIFSPNFAFIIIVLKNSNEVLLLGGPDDMGEPQIIKIALFDRVNDCCVSPDSKWLVSVCDDNLIWLQKLKDLKRPMIVLEGHTAPVVRCSLSLNGKILATASHDGTIKLWDQSHEPNKSNISSGHQGRVTAVTFSPDGSFIVSASADMMLKTWYPAPTAVQKIFEGHLAPVWDCVVFKGNTLIASASEDGTIRFWNADSAKKTRVLSAGDIRAIAYSPSGYLLAAGSYDSVISLWDIATGERIKEAEVGGGPIQDCTFTTDSKCLLLACADGTLRVWDVVTWCELVVLYGHNSLVSCCKAVPETSLAVSGSQDGTLRLWDLSSKTELHAFIGHTDAIWDCAVSASGKILASVGGDGNLCIWNIKMHNLIAKFPINVHLRSVALHPLKPQVACGDYNGWIHVVDIIGLVAT
jgi:WD40 repeat protein